MRYQRAEAAFAEIDFGGVKTLFQAGFVCGWECEMAKSGYALEDDRRDAWLAMLDAGMARGWMLAYYDRIPDRGSVESFDEADAFDLEVDGGETEGMAAARAWSQDPDGEPRRIALAAAMGAAEAVRRVKQQDAESVVMRARLDTARQVRQPADRGIDNP